jgi:nitrate reductase gamma subunit
MNYIAICLIVFACVFGAALLGMFLRALLPEQHLSADSKDTIVTLFVCALSVSGAIFLILEMYTPFEGLMQVSSAPLRNALAHLGQ